MYTLLRMPLVVPGVARFAVNQSLEGRAVVNVLDYRIDTTGSTMSREDAVDGQAGSIIEHWVAQFLPVMVDDLTLDSVSYVDLNTADGVTGSRLNGGGTSLPAAGLSTDPPLPANAALLVTKQAPSGRGRRNGRMFLAGLEEQFTSISNGNRLEEADRAGFETRTQAFLSGTNELDTLGTAFSSNMVVVHITARDASGNPTLGDSSVVQSLIPDALLATQRRRLRG